MSVDTELVAIGVALLGVILGTWAYLHRIDKKLNKLLLLASRKKEEDPDHSSSTQTNNQYSLTNAIGGDVQKSAYNLVQKESFKDKEYNRFGNAR